MTRLGNKILKMKQPIKKRVTNRNKIVKKKVATKKTKKKPLFGTSKLEEDFARDFLDKLDVKLMIMILVNIVNNASKIFVVIVILKIII